MRSLNEKFSRFIDCFEMCMHVISCPCQLFIDHIEVICGKAAVCCGWGYKTPI